MLDFEYQAELDAVWRRLRPHLEWAQGFKLAVLFYSHPAPVAALLQRVKDMLSLNTLRLRFVALQKPEELPTVLAQVLAVRPLGEARPPLWLEMRLDGEAQIKATWQALSRLNERRFLLERDVACPLVLVLPAALRADLPSMLPDLWSIRSYTADLPQPPVETAMSIAGGDDLPGLVSSQEPAPADKRRFLGYRCRFGAP